MKKVQEAQSYVLLANSNQTLNSLSFSYYKYDYFL